MIPGFFFKSLLFRTSLKQNSYWFDPTCILKTFLLRKSNTSITQAPSRLTNQSTSTWLFSKFHPLKTYHAPPVHPEYDPSPSRTTPYQEPPLVEIPYSSKTTRPRVEHPCSCRTTHPMLGASCRQLNFYRRHPHLLLLNPTQMAEEIHRSRKY